MMPLSDPTRSLLRNAPDPVEIPDVTPPRIRAAIAQVEEEKRHLEVLLAIRLHAKPAVARGLRLLPLLLFALLSFGGACAAVPQDAPASSPPMFRTQIPAPGQGDPWTAIWPGRQDVTLHIESEALATIGGLAHASLVLRTELAACVAKFRIIQGDRYVGAFAWGDTVRIAIDSIGHAHPYWSDSLQIRSDRPLCAAGFPVLHTHIVPNAWLYIPSPVDVASAEARSAPFDLLVSVTGTRTWMLTVYGMRREPATILTPTTPR